MRTAIVVTLFLLLPFKTVFADEGYTIQISSQQTKAQAFKDVEDLKEKGVKGFASMVDIPGKGTRYRVNVGHFSSLARAKKARFILKKKGVIPSQSIVAQLENTVPVETPAAPPAENPLLEVTATPPPVPSPTPAPSPMVVASPSPVAPEGAIQPPPIVPSPTPEPQQAETTQKSGPSSWTMSFYALASTTNYNLNFPSGFGTGVNSWSSTSYVSPGAAILPTYRLSPNFEIETGVMFFQRAFNVSYNNGLAVQPGAESYTAYEFPLMFYYWFMKNFSVGIGGYYISNPSNLITQDTFQGAALPDQSLSGNDYGFSGALEYVSSVDGPAFVMSLRYNYGSGNFTAVGSNPQQVFSDMQLLAGVRVGL